MSKKTIHTREYSILINLLRDRRESLELTQSNLAEIIGTDQTYISKIENLERRLDIIELRTICLALKIPLLDFIKELETKLNK